MWEPKVRVSGEAIPYNTLTLHNIGDSRTCVFRGGGPTPDHCKVGARGVYKGRL